MLRLVTNAVSNANVILEGNEGKILKVKGRKNLQVIVVFKGSYWQSLGETRKRSRISYSWLRFEPVTSQIQVFRFTVILACSASQKVVLRRRTEKRIQLR